MKKIFISITLLPSQEINTFVMALNKKIGEKFKLHQIDISDTEFAHISLYNATFPEYNRDSILNGLQRVFGKKQVVEITPERINIKSRFISVVFQKTVSLVSLQDEIIEALNPMREGLLQSKYTEKPEVYSQEELENIHMYGYPFCKDQFSPHMTIAELENTNGGAEAVKEISWEKSITLNKASVRILFTNEIGEKARDVIYFNF